MQTTCWTVSEYIFAQVMSSAIWFACTALGGLIFYKLRHRLAGVLRGVIEEATRRKVPFTAAELSSSSPPPNWGNGRWNCPVCDVTTAHIHPEK